MAAVLAPSSVHSSSHLLLAHRDTFGVIQHRSSSTSHRNPFEAFAPHHHSGANSRSAAASWRHSGPQIIAPAPAAVDATSAKFRRSGPSYSVTPSTSSEASSTSWRSHIRAGAVTRVDVTSGEHLSFLYIPRTLRKGFFRSSSFEGFSAVRLFHRGATSPFNLSSCWHQQGVPGCSGRLSCPLCVAPRCAFGHCEDGSPS